MSHEMGPVGQWVVFAIKVLCAGIILVAVFFTVLTVGPAVETRFFPVVSKLRITQIRSDPEGNSLVYANFRKLRECEYIGIAWYHGNPAGEFERIPVVLLRKDGDTSSPNRPLGLQKSGPWIISVPPDELKANSFARLSHRCNPLWVSTTDFYP